MFFTIHTTGCQHGICCALHHRQGGHLRPLQPRLWHKPQKDWLCWGGTFKIDQNIDYSATSEIVLKYFNQIIPGLLRPLLHVFSRILLVWSDKPHMEFFRRHRFSSYFPLGSKYLFRWGGVRHPRYNITQPKDQHPVWPKVTIAVQIKVKAQIQYKYDPKYKYKTLKIRLCFSGTCAAGSVPQASLTVSTLPRSTTMCNCDENLSVGVLPHRARGVW